MCSCLALISGYSALRALRIQNIYICMNEKGCNLWPQPLQSFIILIQMFTTLLILVIFISNSKNYLISINRLSIYSFGVPRQCRVVMRKTDLLCFIFYYFGKTLMAIQAIFFYWFGIFCHNPGFEEDDGFVCGSSSPLWFPFKVTHPLIELALRMSVLYISISYLPILLVLVVNPLITNYLTLIRIRKFRKVIRHLNKLSIEDQLSRDQLVFMIKYHREITECIQVSNNSLSYDHLPLQIFLPIILAIYMYLFALTNDFFALGYIFLWFFPYFLLCLLGERLEYESSTIAEAVFWNRWYNIEDSTVKTIYKMFLFHLNRPVKLKLKPLAALNHLLIIKILKTAYSFLIFFVDTMN
ncbi:uncharacterized protein LOC123678936 [Harmonia axyridis]|uniref:uncharacterized protein LOC123678936 n=1 Tax=Harmonia axyridis TaxID=115357 RepID=UPI001E2797AA|nr:uncharacterized protein LOC123678936 [Harmonia axyridis]